MELCKLLTTAELWRKIDAFVYGGHGVIILIENYEPLLRMDADSLDGDIIGTAIHMGFDDFMGGLLDLMTIGDKNYHVKMSDSVSNPLTVDAMELIVSGDVVMFTITNENKGD